MVDIVTVKEANLSVRVRNILDRMCIRCLNELQYMTVKELLEVVGMGKGAVKELQDEMKRHGLKIIPCE